MCVQLLGEDVRALLRLRFEPREVGESLVQCIGGGWCSPEDVIHADEREVTVGRRLAGNVDLCVKRLRLDSLDYVANADVHIV